MLQSAQPVLFARPIAAGREEERGRGRAGVRNVNNSLACCQHGDIAGGQGVEGGGGSRRFQGGGGCRS